MKLKKIIKSHSDIVTGLSLEEHILASCSHDTTVKLFDIIRNKLLITFTYHKSEVEAVKLINNQLFSCGQDLCLKNIDISTNRTVNNFIGHSKTVTCLDVYEKVVATGSIDKSVKLWDLRCRDEVYTFNDHNAPVNKVIIKDKVFTFSDDMSMIVYDKRMMNKRIYYQSRIKTGLLTDDRIYLGLNREVVVLNSVYEIVKSIKNEGVSSLDYDIDSLYVGGKDRLDVVNRTGSLTLNLSGRITSIQHNSNFVFCGSSDKTVQVLRK